MAFLFKRRSLPYLAGLIGLKNCSHLQENEPHLYRHLEGPYPNAFYDGNEKLSYKRFMTEAAARAQHLLKVTAAQYHIPGISYTVSINDSAPYTSTYGFADIENNKEIGVESKLRIGYLTMLYTAYLAFQMVADQKIGLDENIASAIPGYPLKSYHAQIPPSAITLNKLLCHTSGLKEYTEAELKSTARENSDMILRAEIQDTDLPNTPGQYMFARYPYLLLSIVIEKTRFSTYSQVLLDSLRKLYRRRIPLRMTDDTILVVQGLSRHYQRNENGILEPANFVIPTNRVGIYGIVAYPELLAFFGLSLVKATYEIPGNFECMYDNKCLRKRYAQMMFKPLSSFPPSFDYPSDQYIIPCIFGKRLHEANNHRTPMAWCSSSVIGSSSILLVQGFVAEQHSLQPALAASSAIPQRKKPHSGPDLAVSVTCNLEGIQFFPLAHQIAGIYEEAFEDFTSWQKSYHRSLPPAPTIAQQPAPMAVDDDDEDEDEAMDVN